MTTVDVKGLSSAYVMNLKHGLGVPKGKQWRSHTFARGPPCLPFEPTPDLEIVERLHLGAHTLQLVIIDLLDLPQRLSHLVLPELAVFGRRVTVR